MIVREFIRSYDALADRLEAWLDEIRVPGDVTNVFVDGFTFEPRGIRQPKARSRLERRPEVYRAETQGDRIVVVWTDDDDESEDSMGMFLDLRPVKKKATVKISGPSDAVVALSEALAESADSYRGKITHEDDGTVYGTLCYAAYSCHKNDVRKWLIARGLDDTFEIDPEPAVITEDDGQP